MPCETDFFPEELPLGRRVEGPHGPQPAQGPFLTLTLAGCVTWEKLFSLSEPGARVCQLKVAASGPRDSGRAKWKEDNHPSFHSQHPIHPHQRLRQM